MNKWKSLSLYLAGALTAGSHKPSKDELSEAEGDQARIELKRAIKALEEMPADVQSKAVSLFTKAALQINQVEVLNTFLQEDSAIGWQKKDLVEPLRQLFHWLAKAPKIVKAISEDTDIEVFERKKDFHYVPNYYGSSSRKLQLLPEIPVFGELATRIQASGHSSLYLDRLYSLFTTLQQIARSQKGSVEPAAVVEVGVYKGGTSVFLAECMKTFNLDHWTLHSCDTFTGHDERDFGSKPEVHKPGHFSDTSEERVRSLLKPYHFSQIHVGRIQDTAESLPHRIAFVHLDPDLYEPIKFGLNFFMKRLIPGGIIVVDDYGSVSCPGVEQAVSEFAEANPQTVVIPLLTGQCLVVKTGF